MAYDISGFTIHPKVGPLYAERVLELANDIEKSSSYDQERWVHPCGTPACIAGHASWVARGLNKRNGTVEEISEFYNAENDDEAEDFLGLTESDAFAMFNACPLWDKDDNSADYIVPDVTNDHAAAMLRNYVATGEVDWFGTKPHDPKVVDVYVPPVDKPKDAE